MPRDRVDGVGRIADECQAPVDGALGQQQRQGIAPAPADRPEIPQAGAEAAGHLGGEGVSVEGHHGGRQVAALGPDDGGTVGPAAGPVLAVDHGQHGEGARGQEVLVGNAAVRAWCPTPWPGCAARAWTCWR